MIAASPARATGECLRRWTTQQYLSMNCCHHRASSRDDMQLRGQLHDQVKEVLYDSEQLGHDLDLDSCRRFLFRAFAPHVRVSYVRLITGIRSIQVDTTIDSACLNLSSCAKVQLCSLAAVSRQGARGREKDD